MPEVKKVSRRIFLAATGASAGLAALLPSSLAAAPQQAPASPDASAAPLPAPLGASFYEKRIARLREMMKTIGAAALVEMPGAGLRSLTGLSLERREHLVCLVLPLEEPPSIYCADTQREPAAGSPLASMSVVAWNESDDPVSLVGRHLRKLDADDKKVVLSGGARYDEFLHLHGELPKATFVSGTALVGFLREHKELEEIGILRAAATRCQLATEASLKEAAEGISAAELAAHVERRLQQSGVGGWARARFGKQTAIPQAWTPERRLARGEVIVLEAISELHGYKARVARTAILGQATGRMKLIHSTLRKVQTSMMERMKPGQPWSYVDRIGRSIMGGGGFSKMLRGLLGLGIGLEAIEPPWSSPGYHEPAAQGHVMSLEPAVYTPDDHGVVLGDMVEVTAAGGRLVTQPPEAIFELG